MKGLIQLTILSLLGFASQAHAVVWTIFSPGGALSGDWQFQSVDLSSGSYILGALPLAKLEPAAANQLLRSNGSTWESVSIPSCLDSVGQHLNYSTSTGLLSCGTSTPSALSGTSASIGGGLLAAGACASATVTVTGATTTMSAVATPVTYPGNGNFWSAQVTAVDTVTVRVCAILLGTPTASTYNVRVLT